MITWVLYDIGSDKIRNKVAKTCKNMGLYRVQKSVFLGTLEDNQFDEIKLYMQSIIDLEKDSVYIFPMSQTNFRTCGLIGQAFDRELVTDEIISKFF